MSQAGYEVLATGRTAEMLAREDGWVLKLFFDWFPEDAVGYEATLGNPLADVARTHIILTGAAALITQEDRELAGIIRRFLEAHEGYHFGLKPGDATEYEMWKLVVAAARMNEGIDDLQDWLFNQVHRGLGRV